jgi:hypothetical protein
LLVTDAVLLEIGNALARRYKQEAVAILEQFLAAEEGEVVHLTPRLFAPGFDARDPAISADELLASDRLLARHPDAYLQHERAAWER